jgi:hypothetical protein
MGVGHAVVCRTWLHGHARSPAVLPSGLSHAEANCTRSTRGWVYGDVGRLWYLSHPLSFVTVTIPPISIEHSSILYTRVT